MKDLIYSTSSKSSSDFSNFGGPVMYIFGALFLLLSLTCLLWYPKAKNKAEKYKKGQMKEYKKINPKGTDIYSETGMYLPPWEKVKQFAPTFFALVFFIIGLAFLIGQPLKLFSR
ncbi:MAG: hypothetical protein GY679_02425 [Mycoplasma sp.]|nr:hypothetical protein [Mycoplasma sp.]